MGKPTRTRSRVAVAQRPRAPEPDALWPVAMLRVAMELKRPDAPGLEEIIDGVVARMGIDRAQFQRYLSQHLGILREEARNAGDVS